MSRQLTALVTTPYETYVTRDGTPYRADDTGMVHVEARHVSELTSITAPPGAAVPTLATTTQMGATRHRGAPLILTVEA